MSMYGREDETWERLTEVSLTFLIERARLGKVTSYTELNTTLERRTGLAAFDFEREIDRRAMGHLLGLVVIRNRPVTGLMISALVHYLDANDAGPGFYTLAKQLRRLPQRATSDEKLSFWINQVNGIHAYYSPSR
ncbi:hypothetical protein V6U90_04240 [Micromonospora sp. CPCC 206060]|uniref:hypothetical protein n=1 Tax=Micromonospora sp. CPCC 206060 TaxID=3122406 RepID=UPI002FF2D7AB